MFKNSFIGEIINLFTQKICGINLQKSPIFFVFYQKMLKNSEKLQNLLTQSLKLC